MLLDLYTNKYSHKIMLSKLVYLVLIFTHKTIEAYVKFKRQFFCREKNIHTIHRS